MKVEDELRAELRRKADAVRPSPSAWDEITKRAEHVRAVREHRSSPGVRRAAVVAFALGIALAAFVLVVWTFGRGGHEATPASRPAGGFIVFGGYTRPSFDDPRPLDPQTVSMVRPDGSGFQTLTQDHAFYSTPTWSPDGTRIVADRLDKSADKNDETVVVMKADGSDMHPIYAPGLPVPVSVLQLAWSPDGSKIAFVRAAYPQGSWSEADVPQDIWVMNADGSGAHEVTQGFQVTSLSWSPVGSRIAFTKQVSINSREFGYAIFTVEPDGTHETRLTDGKSSMNPAWSPSGDSIVFSRVEAGQRFEQRDLFVMNADGSDVRRVTDAPGTDDYPSWSPNGSEIVFDRFPDGTGKTCELMLVRPDGTSEQVVANQDQLNGACADRPVWQPGVTSSVVEVTPSADASPQPSSSTDCPDLSAVNISGAGSAEREDARSLAKDEGMTYHDALAASSLQDDIGNLQAALHRDPPQGYDGQYISYDPCYRLEVLITSGDGSVVTRAAEDAGLGRIVPFIRYRSVPYGEAELSAAHEEIIKLAQGIRNDSGTDVVALTVDITVETQADADALRGRIEDAIASGDITIPEQAIVIKVGPLASY